MSRGRYHVTNARLRSAHADGRRTARPSDLHGASIGQRDGRQHARSVGAQGSASGGWPALRPYAKRAIDVAGSLILLLLASPIFLLLLVAARLEGGPAVYVHRRIGRGHVPFGCLKFRTMVVGADRVLADLLARDPEARAEWEATWKLKSDPRVTRLGSVLRATSLDELPQLLNVLRGDMSLVGPRPVVQAELDTLYGPAAVLYLSVRPGLTGPWQVSGRSDADYQGRVALDSAYVRHPSLRTDLRILLRTVGAVLRRRGAY
jgi:lipopolysaccharide/colanic/teichoic acid biosynthesis glycosyltransferase